MGHKARKESNKKILSKKEDINEENNSKLENTSKTRNIDKYKYEFTHYKENKDSIYPEIKRCIKGTKRLEDIYNYLKSKNIDNYNKNNKKIWPSFIIEAIEHNEKNKKSKENIKNKEK